MNFVIGSGPSGAACAMALIGRGQPVTLLDAGVELEPERRRAVERLRAMDPSEWRGEAVEFLRHSEPPGRKGLGVKHVYGSDYPYRDVDRLTPIETEGAELTSTLALGGFSTIWGANMLPYLPDDIADWPIGISDLAPHYEAVLSFMDTSMVEDDLAELFPLYTARRSPLRRSAQAEGMLRDLAKNRQRLRAEGIWFGSSRSAVRAEARDGAPGCVSCGLCMYGCPYGLIYNSENTFRALDSNPLFRRISGVVVDRLREVGPNEVEITGRRREDEAPVTLKASRVYLAAGPLSSTRILLRSMEAYNRPVTLRDNQYYLFPMLRYAGTRGVMKEPLHTLSQIFLEILDPAVSTRTVHLQVYTYNDLYVGAIRRELGWAAGLLEPVLRPLIGRLLLAIGYLHSDHSRSIEVSLERGGRLRLKGESARTAEVDASIQRVLRKLSRNARFLRARPLPFLLNRTPPGRGWRSGGTFPMRHNPSGFETDILGRPVGFSRVHVVDSTVLPSLPATTAAFSVMANAHRIATLSHGE
jgi:choline dehydrogenase-like flavoprotein